MIPSVVGNLILITAYGVLCACFGALVYSTYLKHWPK
jgi:hypothetical protein